MRPLHLMVDWIQTNEVMLYGLAGASAFVFVATLLAIPWLVVRIPDDYFIRKRRVGGHWPRRHPALRGLLIAGKKLFGAALVVVGTAMLVLPGQGVMTILVGIMLLDFPGKYRLERWVASRPPVLRAINWMRRRAGRPPLVVHEQREP